MKTQYIRGASPLHIAQLAAAATLVFAGIFILYAVFPTSAHAVVDPPVVDPLSFTVTEGETYDGTLTATYSGPGNLSFNLTQAPYHGTLLLSADGNFSYKADVQDQNESFTSTDSFNIVASADGMNSDPVTVDITITPLPDITPPQLHTVGVSNHYGEVSGDNVFTEVSVRDNRSNVAEVCLWIGDEADNLLPTEACKNITERDSNSYVYAPSFQYQFNSHLIPDGTYSIYVYAADMAGNAGTSTANQTITVNNLSVGSPSQPVDITDCEELQAINEHVGWYYELANDIDCSETRTWNGGEGFEALSIGSSLLGNDHTVSGIYMDSDYSGIMTPESGAVIHGVNLRDVDLTCSKTYCGGFAHNIWGTIEQSSITGTLNCSGKCGGFGVQHSGFITESWAGMTIIGGGRASGFAGHSSNGIVRDSYFRGHLATGSGGGIVGLNDGWNGLGKVLSSYAANTFSPSSLNSAGGLIGWQYKGDQNQSYWDAELSGLTVMCGQGDKNCQDDHGLSTALMKDVTSYPEWDFDKVWAIDGEKNDGYPYLQWQTSFYEPHADEDDTGSENDDEGDGEEEEPPVVDDPEPRQRSSGSATRIGDRESNQSTGGQVLGVTTNAEEETLLTYQRQIVSLLQQLVNLLAQL